jgi:hypothetical protein
MAATAASISRAIKPQEQRPVFSNVLPASAVADAEYFRRLWNSGPNGTKKNIASFLQDGAWSGRRCFIMAGGPSIREWSNEKLHHEKRPDPALNFSIFDEFLKGELSIGVNRAFQYFPSLTINMASDYTYYRELNDPGRDDPSKRRYQKYQGIKLWVDHVNRKMDNCYYVRSAGREGISWTLQGIYTHSNTGYSAINLALALGANPIYLMGYDLTEDESGHTHFHDYATTTFHSKSWAIFNEGLDGLAKRLKDSRKHFNIINLSPITAVRAFSKGDFMRDVLYIDQDNYFTRPEIAKKIFMAKYCKPMLCYISGRELSSVNCRTVAEFERLIGRDDPEFFKDKLFLRRAA